jgi:serralysin
MLARYIALALINLAPGTAPAIAQANMRLGSTVVASSQIGTSGGEARTITGTYQEFLVALGHSESTNRDWYVNPDGYAGYFQFGETALRMIGYYDHDGTAAIDWNGGWTANARAEGINSLQDFLNSHAFQEKAITEYYRYLWRTNFEGSTLKGYIGQTVAGIKITASGLIAGSHLVGANNVEAFLKSAGANVATDPYGTKVSEYLSKFGGYDVSLVIGRNGSPQ